MELRDAKQRGGCDVPQPESLPTQNTLRCEQCGRVGTRGFKRYPTFTHHMFGAIPPITVCSNTNACRKRWPKVLVDDE